jgi:hypothetical protein
MHSIVNYIRAVILINPIMMPEARLQHTKGELIEPGGLATMAPERGSDVISLGLKSIVAAR